MSVIAAALKHMLAANMPHEAILKAVEDMERGLQTDEQAERRRASDRERQRVRRLRTSAESADAADGPHASVTRGEDKPLPQKIEPQESKKEPSALSRLEGVLDAEHAKAVIDHRQRLRKPLTPYAAKLLADKLATFPDPCAAVDQMIERGWQTVYAEDRPPQARGSPSIPGPKPNSIQAAIERRRASQNGTDGLPERVGNAPVFQLSDFSKR